MRDVWPKGDVRFTPWLTTNIGELDRVLGIGLNDARRNQLAGDFRTVVMTTTMKTL